MTHNKEKYYRDLHQQYLSQGKGSLRSFSRSKNISSSTLNLWFRRFEDEDIASGSKLIPFTVVSESESIPPCITKPVSPNNSVLNLQLSTPKGIVVVIPEITLVSLSELLKSFIE